PVLAKMEYTGVYLDVPFLREMADHLSAQLATLERAIYESAGGEFNINSPKQLGEVLFERLGLPSKGVKKTKTGYSTNHSVLEKLHGVHPVVEYMLEYRSIHKIQSTYVDALPREVSPITGRLHTRLNQTIAATGRLSSSQPNLQNIPIQTALGREVRKAFAAEGGKVLVSADYSQIELRLLAHLSEDEAFIESFRSGEDIHARTAAEILGLPSTFSISKEERRLGKTINFGIVYGMSAFRLSRELEIPISEATHYIEQYFARYPRVKQYFASLEQQLDSVGEVRTLFGRRRLVSEIDVRGRDGSRDSGFVRRASLNAPLQGSAADIIKLAMIRIDKRLMAAGDPFQMILQVHDELLFEVPEENVELAVDLIREEMEHVVELLVPLEVSVAKGRNWEEAH
ncbi:MAG: DNA polymerase I, partial [Bdellovibrionales bacterium]|nr:DNA polymerase I [Bdellovibrionales bacterium]